MENWSFIDNENMDSVLATWEYKLMSIIERTIPKCRASSRKEVPWMNRQIKVKLNQRNRLFQKAKKNGSATQLDLYRSCRNEVVDLLRAAKKKYLQMAARKNFGV